MFQKPTRLPNPNPKSNLRLFIKASRAMGGKGKQPVKTPGRAGRKPTSGRPSLGFQKDVSEAPFPCGFHPCPEAATAGRGAVGTESRGSRQRRRRRDRSAEPERERGPGPPLLSGVLKSRGRPGRRQLASPGARAGVPAAHLLSPSWPGAWRCLPVRSPQQTFNGEMMRGGGHRGHSGRTPVPLPRRSGRPHAATSPPARGLSPPLTAAPAG